jgi:hypothetical protein
MKNKETRSVDRYYAERKHIAEQVGKNQEKEMEKIVNELKILKMKRDRKELQKEDSLRIEYLYNQYQELKNGG